MVENDIPTVGVVNQPSLNTLNSVSKKIQIRTKSKILGVVREQYLRLRNSLLCHYTWYSMHAKRHLARRSFAGDFLQTIISVYAYFGKESFLQMCILAKELFCM